MDFNRISSKFPFLNFKTPLSCIFILFSFSIIPLYLFVEYFKKTPDASNVIPKSIEKMDSEIVSYLVTYILPFLSLPDERKIWIILIFLLVVGILYMKSDMIAINPIFMLMGYHIVSITFIKKEWSTEKHGILISKLMPYELKNKSKIKITNVHGDIYFLKEVVE